jgi:hypothetical protein
MTDDRKPDGRYGLFPNGGNLHSATFVCMNTSHRGSGVLFVDYGWHFEHLQVYS